MKAIVEALAEANFITLTHSDWAAPSTLVSKTDGTFFLIVDYRGLNKKQKKHAGLFRELLF